MVFFLSVTDSGSCLRSSRPKSSNLSQNPNRSVFYQMSPNPNSNIEMSSSSSSPPSSVSSDLPQHLQLLVECTEQSDSAGQLVRKMIAELAPGTESGLSFLELKNHLMLDYLTNLTYLQLVKASGKSLVNEPVVLRLVELRTVLEKMRPMEQKLKYQIDKALKVAESGTIRPDDPLHFKANPSALMGKLTAGGGDEEDSEDADPESKAASSEGKYVVPKHVPAYYDEDKSKETLEEEAGKKEKKKLLSKSLIEDLKRQHLDTPEEVYEQEDTMKKRKIEAIRERTRYEEENFTRLPLSKKMKHSRKQMSTIGTIGDEITSFGLNYFSEKGGGGDKKKGGGGKNRGRKSGKSKKKFRK